VKSEACKLIIPVEFDRKTAQISRYDLISVVKKLQLLLKYELKESNDSELFDHMIRVILQQALD
jgi:hypothetical protein